MREMVEQEGNVFHLLLLLLLLRIVNISPGCFLVLFESLTVNMGPFRVNAATISCCSRLLSSLLVLESTQPGGFVRFQAYCGYEVPFVWSAVQYSAIQYNTTQRRRGYTMLQCLH